MAETSDHGGVPASDVGAGRDMFPRNFPDGLRVLVFDEDPAYLQILERHLQEFQYQVTTCNKENEAMSLLRDYKNRFDIAMIQVNNSDGDRIRFISEIGSETDLSIIIISKDDSVQSVVEWMSNGATDYLIKPVKPQDLRIIFKHVVRKMRARRSVLTAEEAEEKTAGEKSSSVGDSTIKNPNKTKRSSCPNSEGVNDEDHHDHDRVFASSSKKRRRVVWDGKLHKKFLDAVNCLGPNNSVPKKILEMMNVENLSRENVASHLQKFRMSLKKENDTIKSDETTNLSLITSQEGIMYVGADSSNFSRGRNVQFPTQHINNIPQASYVQQQYTTNSNNLMTNLIPPFEHHYDEPVVAASSGGLVMNHQYHHHHHHQTTNFTVEETFAYNNFYEEDSSLENLMLTPNPEQVELYPNQDYTSFKMKNGQKDETTISSMLHLPPLISPPHTYQRESGGFTNNKNGVTRAVNNNRST